MADDLFFSFLGQGNIDSLSSMGKVPSDITHSCVDIFYPGGGFLTLLPYYWYGDTRTSNRGAGRGSWQFRRLWIAAPSQRQASKEQENEKT